MPAADLDLLVLGDANPDLILSGPDVVPAFGQAEQLLDAAELVIGGSGAITACGAARLGLRTAIAGVVGEDRFGAFMADALLERGVDTSGLVRDARVDTGISVILRRPDDRAILTYPGAIAALTVEAVDPELVARAQHVHVSSFFLQAELVGGLRELLAGVRRRGGTTSLDPNWDPTERWDGGLSDLLGELDVLLPNAAEACALAGETDAVAAAAALALAGPTVVVKLGADGAVAARGSDPPLTARPPAHVIVTDAVGAGDSFDAGWLAGMLGGRSLAGALALACACGALSTRAAGGTGAQPTLGEADAHAAGVLGTER